jgi:DNA-binding beta-propeller fold protein YncE
VLDSTTNRLIVPGQGNGNILIFQLDENGLPLRRTADHVLGHESTYGRRTSSGDVASDTLPFSTSPGIDEVNQRLFAVDRTVNSWGPGLRILVFDIHPDTIETGSEAIAVIGAPDFESRETGIGPNRFQSASVLVDSAGQRLFVTDGPNNRILVFDIRPDQLGNDPDAFAVIGQADFDSRVPGLSASGLSRPGGVALDHVNQRLFVGDSGNNRILIFDVNPDRFESNPEAIAVLGQSDFVSRNPRQSDTQIGPGNMAYDDRTGRIMMSDSGNNRILAYDVAPERLTNFPEPIGIIGQPDYETVTDNRLTFDPEFAQSKTYGPRITGGSISAQHQLLYVSEGYWAGNRVGIFDISGEGDSLSGGNMVDVIGHIDEEGGPSFTARAANDRIDDRSHYPRSVALDPVDHRLFTIDQYNHRVMVWQLDPQNQLLDRTAIRVIGQPDFSTDTIPEPTSQTFRIPGAVAYDPGQKLLFVGDGNYNRVLVFDADPERLTNFPEAIAVLGQQDFTSVTAEMTRTSINFDVERGRYGITSSNPRAMGIAVDSDRQRLFVSDGPNYRVLVFDISPGQLRNGAPATAVIGKPDFTSGRNVVTDRANGVAATPQGPATRNAFSSMAGDLVFDSNNDRLFVADARSNRVMVFNVAPEQLENGIDAIAVLGQQNFETTGDVRLDTQQVSEDEGRRVLRWPDGFAYDTVNDRLIMSDKGNDRVLVFDVAPGLLETGMGARFVLGQPDFVTRDPGRGRQDQLADVRGIAFDSEHQRLYATDSFWARVMVFDFARSDRDVSLAPFGTQVYSTIDASIDQDLAPQFGFARVSLPVSTAAVYSITQNRLDNASTRESRLLLSETAVEAQPALIVTEVLGRHDDSQETLFLINNSTGREALLSFTFRDGAGRIINTSGVPMVPDGQRRVSTDQLLGDGVTQSGIVTIESNEPVSVSALTITTNERRERIVSAAPILDLRNTPPSTVVPSVSNGAGHRTRISLANPSDETLEGRIEFFLPSGESDGSPAMPYQIPAWGTFEHITDGQPLIARKSYAKVTPANSGLPAVTAMVELSDGETLISRSNIDTTGPIQRAWIPVNTMPTPIRHGNIEATFTILNDSPIGASLRFRLYSLDGTEVDRYEMIVRENSQQEFSLVQLFNLGQFKGTLNVFSDVPVAIHAEQETVNLRGEPIAMQLPVFEPGTDVETVLDLGDGDGLTTEIIMVNTEEIAKSGELSTLDEAAQPLRLPLR